MSLTDEHLRAMRFLALHRGGWGFSLLRNAPSNLPHFGAKTWARGARRIARKIAWLPEVLGMGSNKDSQMTRRNGKAVGRPSSRLRYFLTRVLTTPKQWTTAIAWIGGQLVVFGGVLAGLIYWTAAGDERVNLVLGLFVVTSWLAFVLWGLTQIALSARREQRDRDYLTGLVVGCALGVGIMLIVYRLIEGDVVGIGFELVLISSFVIWFAGSQARRRRK